MISIIYSYKLLLFGLELDLIDYLKGIPIHLSYPPVPLRIIIIKNKITAIIVNTLSVKLVWSCSSFVIFNVFFFFILNLVWSETLLLSPENEQSLKVLNFLFKLSNRNFSNLLSFRLIVVKAKSPILSLENLRGIVRRAKPRKPAKSVKPTSQKVQKKRTVRQRFFNQNYVVFLFLLLAITTEAMGTGGLRAYSLSHSDKANAGAKPAKCTSASL